MKKFSKVLISCVIAMSMFLVSCSSGAKIVSKNEGTFTVGICQLVQHEALDSATKGFMDVLTKHFGDKVKILNQNASGDSANCTTIINGFVSGKVDLIMANATPPLQAAASMTKNIPILGTSVTDYASALEVDGFTGVLGNNISGTSDLAPLKDQADMILEWVPNCKTVGILFCSAESNSVYQVNEMKKYLGEKNIEVKEFSFTDSNDVMAVTKNACQSVDAIYIPTDNMAASNIEAIGSIVLKDNIPTITGEQGPCKVCGVATLSINYYDLGTKTGEMAIDILEKKQDVKNMKIEYAPKVVKMYNEEVVKKLGLTVPSGDYEKIS